ncbi:MAG TPA: hypothetical protein PL126_00950, partial [Candidatus Cloacimonadota bacterium]|nr:hypothetical protein [Candidatus Cloacimonadota bacterium]
LSVYMGHAGILGTETYLRGQKVYTEKFAKDAGAELFWNGKDQKGRNCSSGIYLLKVNLRDGRGFTKRMVKM